MAKPKPVQPRYESMQQAGFQPFPDKESRYVNNTLETYLNDNFGLMLGENKKVPKRGLMIPRMFVMGKNAKGKDFPLDVNDLPYKPGSQEFQEQIRLGNVFVYPAGKEKPVQLQLHPPEGAGLAPTYDSSDPLEPEQMPAPPVKPLTRAQKILRFITFGFAYRSEQKAWEQAQQDHSDVVKKLRDNQSVSKHELDAEIQAQKEEKVRRELQRDLKDAQTDKDDIALGKKNFVSVFQPVPEKQAQLLRRSKGNVLGQKYGFYDEKDFRDLTIFSDDEKGVRDKLKQKDDELEKQNLDLAAEKNVPPEKRKGMHPNEQSEGKDYQFESFDPKKVNLNGKPLTDAQFSSVALAACFQTKLTLENNKLNPASYDPTAVDALKNCGVPENEAQEIVSNAGRSMGTLDLFINPPRDNSGFRFKKYVNEGRKDASEAFRQYQAGNPQPLAKLIADGVNKFSQEFCQCTTDRLPTQQRGTAVMAEELLGLMEQAPELKELAKQEGMDPNRLTNLQGIVKILNLEKQARNAEYEIAKARAEGAPLDKNQKAAYSKQIIMSQIAGGKLVEHNKKLAADKNSKSNRLKDSIQWSPEPRGEDGQPLPAEQWPTPEPGHMYYRSMLPVAGGLRYVYDPLPPYADEINNPEGMKSLEKMAEQIVKQEKLDEMSPEELYQKLNKRKLDLGGSIMKARENLKQANPGLKKDDQQAVQQDKEVLHQEGPENPEVKPALIP